MLELVFAPAEEWIGRSDEDIIAATMRVRGLAISCCTKTAVWRCRTTSSRVCPCCCWLIHSWGMLGTALSIRQRTEPCSTCGAMWHL